MEMLSKIDDTHNNWQQNSLIITKYKIEVKTDLTNPFLLI
jgi:hypothetical protein